VFSKQSVEESKPGLGGRTVLVGKRESAAQLVERYALVVLTLATIVFFYGLKPDTFGTLNNVQAILSRQSILILIAFGVMLPLIVGEFDVSVTGTMGLTAILVAGLPGQTSLPTIVVVIIALLAGVAVGVVNAVLVTRLQVSSIVATLGTGTIVGGIVFWYSGGRVLFSNFPEALSDATVGEWFAIPKVTFYSGAVALALWYFLTQTPTGQYMYARGSSREAAHILGLPARRMAAVSLVLASFLGGLAGLLQVSTQGAGHPELGPPFLLPAFATVFLGRSALRPGQFTVQGTITGVLFVAVGVSGLQLMGVPFYVEPIFYGCSLIAAVVLSTVLKNSSDEGGGGG
jgi:ribose transport system permease protein